MEQVNSQKTHRKDSRTWSFLVVLICSFQMIGTGARTTRRSRARSVAQNETDMAEVSNRVWYITIVSLLLWGRLNVASVL